MSDEEYEYLKEGDIVQKDDEVNPWGYWIKAHQIGHTVEEGEDFRRRKQPSASVTVEAEYEYLKEGDVIQKGDEFQEIANGPWWTTCIGGLGYQVEKGKYRRRKQPAADTAPVDAAPATFDPIQHPSHYNQYPIQPIQLSRHLSHNRGAAVNYITRAAFKGSEVDDLRKAIWHLEDELQLLTGEGSHAKP